MPPESDFPREPRYGLGIAIAAVIGIAAGIAVFKPFSPKRAPVLPTDERYYGRVVDVRGRVESRRVNEFAFTPLRKGDPLVYGEFIMTEEGSELAYESGGYTQKTMPGSLIRLSYEVVRDVRGVSRQPVIEVVRGADPVLAEAPALEESRPEPGAPETAPRPTRAAPRIVRVDPVSGARTAATPTPSPSPSVNATPTPTPTLSPTPTASLAVTRPRPSAPAPRPEEVPAPSSLTIETPEADAILPGGETPIRVRAEPPGAGVRLTIERIEPNGKASLLLTRQLLVGTDRLVSIAPKIEQAGKYQIHLRRADGSVLKGLDARRVFTVRLASQSIRATLELEGDSSSRKLRIEWRAPKAGQACRIRIWDQPNTAAAARLDRSAGAAGILRVPVDGWRSPRAFYQIDCSAPGAQVAERATLGPSGAVVYPRAPLLALDLSSVPGGLLRWKALPYAESYEVRRAGPGVDAKVFETREPSFKLDSAGAAPSPGGWEVRARYSAEQFGPWSTPVPARSAGPSPTSR